MKRNWNRKLLAFCGSLAVLCSLTAALPAYAENEPEEVTESAVDTEAEETAENDAEAEESEADTEDADGAEAEDAAEDADEADAEDAARQLAELGFENVRVSEQNDGHTVFAAFESVSYRGTYRGAAVGIEELGKLYPDANTFKVMLLENQMPQVALTATRADGQWLVKGGYTIAK